MSTSTTAPADRSLDRLAERHRSEEAHVANVHRVIRDLGQLRDLGHVTAFDHRVEPHKNRPEWTVDLFRVTFADDRQMELTFAEARLYLRGFFAGRNYPRATLTPPPTGR